MSETLVKNNEYTISILDEQKTEDNDRYPAVHMHTSLTRTFNFLSCQLTTRTSERIYQALYDHAGGSAAVSSQTIIENFYDLPSTGEVELMHAKLVELGGKPPALEGVLGGLNKKSFPLNPKG